MLREPPFLPSLCVQKSTLGPQRITVSDGPLNSAYPLPFFRNQVNKCSASFTDSSSYAHFIFNTFDTNKDGMINFEVFCSFHFILDNFRLSLNLFKLLRL